MSKTKTNANICEDLSSSSGSSSSLSSDEEIDSRDLKPIKDYLLNRRELARQLFKSVKAEKIRMMLPQTLKKMDFGELEEWCATELSGMSKTRILSILNGKPMVESSNTSESDDSGPSLEIISDTEEWFTDDDASKQDDGSKTGKMKNKKDRVKLKGKSLSLKKNDVKPGNKRASMIKNVQIKKEDETETKGKEGDSLLDLLELEMRARAIRALIRKEEDVIPTPNASKSVNHNSLNEKLVTKVTQDELKQKEDCRRQLERIISAQRGSVGDDEDVVLVVQPTPTIELLTSDSEGEGHNGERVNQKFQNERVLDPEKSSNIENENVNNAHTANTVKDEKEKEKSQESAEIRKDVDIRKREVVKRTHNSNTDDKNTESPASSKPSRKKRKLKKKPHVKDKVENINSEKEAETSKSDNTSQITETATATKSSPSDRVTESMNGTQADNKELDRSIESKTAKDSSPLGEQNSTKQQELANKRISDEDMSTDSDEIIDLDDYCHDMDDMENNGNDKCPNIKIKIEKTMSQTEAGTTKKSNAAETWASRYYQTDDVQNVIKESKIQSEIRKRLRERQRLSKLNKSPNSNSPSSPSVGETIDNKLDEKPTGSVDEYLAIKRTTPANLSSSITKDGVNGTEDKDTLSNSTVIDDSSTAIDDNCTAIDGNCTIIPDNSTVTTVSHTDDAHSREGDNDKQVKENNDVNVNSSLVVEKTEIVDTNNV